MHETQKTETVPAGKPTIRSFLSAARADLGARMSGALSVPFSTAAIWTDPKYGQYIWVALAVISFLAMAYFVWAHERNQLLAFQDRLSPKIHVSVDGDGILTVPTQDGALSKWAQVIVESITDAPLVDCEVWVKGIYRLNPDGSDMASILEESTRCEWSQRRGPESFTVTIPPKVKQRANLFSLLETPSVERPIPAPQPTLEFAKLILTTEIQYPSSYRVYLTVTAKEVPSREESFVFDWKDFDRLTLKQEAPVASGASVSAVPVKRPGLRPGSLQ